MQIRRINVGIIGYGTVGAGVAECLIRNGELIGLRTGIHPHLARIADLDTTSDRGVVLPAETKFTNQADDVLNDPDVDVVVELVGGTGVAKKFILKALHNGKPVITANKALLANHGDEIFAAAKASAADVYYEASVAGGIPIIKAMREGLVANRVVELVGILNGTCNYILTRMEQEGAPFADILAEAQREGYAETPPDLDIDGIDTAHKATILASLAYGEWFGMGPVYTEGIRTISIVDIRYAMKLGYRIKLLAILKQHDGEKVQMRVHPALIPEKAMLANVSGVFNAVWVRGDVVGDTMYYGRGAGREATSSAVVADIIDVGLNLKFGSHRRVPAFRPHAGYAGIVHMDDVMTRYYVRLQVHNRPGTLAQVAGALAKHTISIASVTQQEITGETTPVILLTYKAREADMMAALAEINQLDAVTEPPIRIRIEDLP